MEKNVNSELNIQGNINTQNMIEDGEIKEILELEGIEVWGQHQNVLEQQALTHLQSLTKKQSTSQNIQVLEDGELSNESSSISISATAPKVQNNNLDLSKYLERQELLKQTFLRKNIKKKQSSVSDKSKEAADKVIAKLHLNKEKISIKNKSKRPRQHSEGSNNLETVTSNELEHNKVTKFKNNRNWKDNGGCNQLNENVPNLQGQELESQLEFDSGSEYCPSDGYKTDDSEFNPINTERNTVKRRRKEQCNEKISDKVSDKIKDDGLLKNYTERIHEYKNKQVLNLQLDTEYTIDGNLKIPEKVWKKLYIYQQDGVKWLWDIHKLVVGGLLGDEMGLGKTVQIIVFLAAIEYSKIKSHNNRYTGLGPSIIVCPATVIHQWVKHFHDWWPSFRIALLHQSGSYIGNKFNLISDINKNNGILVTTYESILKYKGVLAEKKWHYMILDEGHKIRNPSAKITVAVKQFRTPHKLILTGSPMQNNLQELWSLFDFIVPGKLGSQQAFGDYFATPITQGGYTNATPTQETTALLIATSLKNMISPFMLRRTKDEVRDCIFLPNKSEQILFCSLTDEQRDLYKGFLLSDHVGGILGRTSGRYSDNHRRTNVLMAITTLRKICNHPDLYLGEADDPNGPNPDEVILYEKTFGYYKRSGKMIVVAALLKIWKRQKHRVLLFTQSRSMIGIFEDLLRHENYKYMKMDGSTSISSRQPLIEQFNKDTSFDIFLLTTRVGGLGVNLTGANRVIIYDPDWNPATDTQARERAWRIGQMKQVTVYRLVSAGTIEEKMYQRQVWKQLLSNKILIDPKTKRFFKSSDLTELFSLQEDQATNPETANIFRNSKVEVNSDKAPRKIPELETAISFSEDKIQKMKSLAQQISKSMSTKIELKSQSNGEVKFKKPTPLELLLINRKKLEKIEEPIVNKIDDKQTNISFIDALTIAEKKTNIPHKIPKEIEPKVEATSSKKREKEMVKIDESGQIDGELVEGLLKREIKKKDKTRKIKKDANQDQYVLEKLFSKKGVHTALQHDVIVQSGYKDRNNLKIHYEAQKKADMALTALRKSRLNNWRY